MMNPMPIPRSWVQQGLLDYIAPQIYWPFARDAAPL
ncbi:glycoside hydrolase [Klebsiella pneumoniae subsp. ozaenae]|uniref:Glycoside hydrolase n=1 Tax=Klebsiella pneumoniae subsp. ozaenae TaxID=574 RepID=A0A378B1X2_KLEPO|nr:glycoside hydrolase [Klebsiella pneumoniae subsp. ozaenae]